MLENTVDPGSGRNLRRTGLSEIGMRIFEEEPGAAATVAYGATVPQLLNGTRDGSALGACELGKQPMGDSQRDLDRPVSPPPEAVGELPEQAADLWWKGVPSREGESDHSFVGLSHRAPHELDCDLGPRGDRELKAAIEHGHARGLEDGPGSAPREGLPPPTLTRSQYVAPAEQLNPRPSHHLLLAE